MAKKIVGNFQVEGEVVSHGRVVATIPMSATAQHRVRVRNLSTLSYDIELEQRLPDPKPPRPFSFTGTADRWSAQWPCVTGSKPLEQSCDLVVHGPAAINQRVWTSALLYRLANAGFGMGTGGLYVTVTAAPLPVEVTLTVT